MFNKNGILNGIQVLSGRQQDKHFSSQSQLCITFDTTPIHIGDEPEISRDVPLQCIKCSFILTTHSRKIKNQLGAKLYTLILLRAGSRATRTRIISQEQVRRVGPLLNCKTYESHQLKANYLFRISICLFVYKFRYSVHFGLAISQIFRYPSVATNCA